MEKRDSKKWTKEEIKQGINSSDRWLYRGVLAIYAKQTADEKDSSTTRYNNKMGFSACDAEFLSSLARQLLSRGTLSVKQTDYARKCMQKYVGQLCRVANGVLQ